MNFIRIFYSKKSCHKKTVREASKKNANFFQKGGGGQPQSLHLKNQMFDELTKIQNRFQKVYFSRGEGGGQGQFGKSLHFF